MIEEFNNMFVNESKITNISWDWRLREHINYVVKKISGQSFKKRFFTHFSFRVNNFEPFFPLFFHFMNKFWRILKVSVNSYYAVTCGYQYTKGDCVVTIDADLQDPPELIHEMVKKWEKGFKIVYAKRKMREESLFKTLTADFFYNVINMLSQTPIPRNVGDFRLIDKHVVELLNHMPERFRFLRGMVAWGGFPSTYVYFDRKKRLTGETHYPLSKMIGFALNGIVSFSTRPLRIAIYVGILASIIGIVGIIYAIYRRLFLPSAYWVPGWTATFVAIMFFGGVQLITIGIIGEYIGKIYSEIQGRPQYLVKEKVNI